MSWHRLYKYFSERQWADAFLDGGILFRSLAYFRDYEEEEQENVRHDDCEGVNRYRPAKGLEIQNLSRGTNSVHSAEFRGTVKQGEIFVFCLSRVLSSDIAMRFGAVACVEINEPGRFLVRLKKSLPESAKFAAKRVRYYRPTNDPNPFWALPEEIAVSKLDRLKWQSEFRCIFSVTDALDFQKASYQIVFGEPLRVRDASQHHDWRVNAGSLHDICRLVEP